MGNLAFTTDPCQDVVVVFENVGFSINASFLTYENYGAVGDGVADDTAKIQATINASAAGAGPIHPAAKTYKVTAALTVPSNVSIYNAPNTVYDMRSAPAGTALFRMVGTAAAAVTVSAMIDGGDTSVTVIAGSETGFVAGDMVKIFSDDIFDEAQTDTNNGELNYVQGVSTGLITLRSPVIGSYVTNPRIMKITPKVDITINNGKVLGSPLVSQQGVFGQYCDACVIERMRFEGLINTNVLFQDSLACKVFDNTFVDAISAATGNAIGFGLACRFCEAKGNYARNVRSGFAIVSGSGGYGIVRECEIGYNKFEDTLVDAISLRAGCDEILVEANLINGPLASGIMTQGKRVRMLNNKVHRSVAVGIYMQIGTDSQGTTMIIGNVVINAGGVGIQVDISSGTPVPPGWYVAMIAKNRIERSLGTGLRISDSTDVSRAVQVEGNVLVDVGESIASPIAILIDGVRTFVANGNVVTGLSPAGVGMRVSDSFKGAVQGNSFQFDGAATGVCIDVTNTRGLAIGGNVADFMDASPIGLRGVNVAADCSEISVGLNDFANCNSPISPQSYTIAGGVLTLPWNCPYIAIGIDTEGGAATDDLNTINGIPKGARQIFRPSTGARDVVFKHNAGNLYLGADFTLTSTRDKVEFYAITGAVSELHLLSKSDNEV